MKFFSSTILYTRMSTNNVNIVNRNNWFQKMNTIGTQNVTNMVLSGTDSNVQMALISVANDVHYCYSNYPLSKTNGFTLTFQLYITGTNMNSICAYFGVTDPTTSFDANSGLANQLGAIELMIRPGGGSGGQSIFNTYANYSGSSELGPTSATAVATGAWQTVKITYTPNSVGTWVVNYNGTDIISYNDSSYTTFANNQNTVWGIYGSTANTVSASIRAVDLSVKQSMPLSVLKDTYSFYPEECYINKLSTNSQKNVAAAFGLRLLEADYFGPLINVRRGSDNATLDFYADSKGNLGTNLQGHGTSLLGWLAGSIGYVTRWYDQSGNGRDVINTTTAQQPKIGTPILDTVSTKNTARGVYTLYRANSTYTGPTIKLRRSSDNAVSDFYADVYGNLINSTGTSFTSWISTSTAYVDTWYDQSGSGNHATQSTTAFQPVYNGTLKLIDSLNSSSLFLNMPSGTIPTGTLNAPYSFVVKHGSISNAGTLIGAGIQSNNQSNVLRAASAESAAYRNYWWFNDFDIGSPSDIVNGTTVTFTYNGTVQTGYINKGGADTLLKTTSGRTGGTTAAGQQSLFRNTNAGEYLNGQMYSVFIFGSALSDADRYACQANPTEINITYDGSQQLYAGSTNYPLNSGLDTYTYIADIKIGDISANRNIISSGTITNNNRASLISVSGTYGFAGHYNDVLIVPTGSSAKRRIVMMCNHNLSSGNIVINDNGTMYTGTTTSPSALNVGNGFYIGTNGSSEYFIGNINEIIVFRNTLTTKESMLYFTPETITRKAYNSQPCLQINYLQKDIGPIPSGAIVQIDTQMLQNLSPGTPVTSWGGFTAYNSPVLNAAIYSTAVTPDPPYVSLTNNNVASSLSTGQYLEVGSKTFNINTNGGFTAVCFCRFIGTANNFERIFDFGSGQANNNLIGYRDATTTNMNFLLFNSSTPYSITATGAITQNEWAVWTFRYTASTRLMEILKNGVVLVTGTAGAAITDKTLTSNRIGRSNWASGDTYGNISIAGLYMYASFLTDAQVASISNHLMYPNSSIMPSILPDYNNKVVRYGSVLSQGFRDAQSMRFNGNVGSYLDIQDVPNWPFTFSFWFYNTSTANTTPAALCSADLTGFGIQTDITSNGTVLTPYYSTNGSSWVAMTASAVALNVWYHITYVVTPTTLAYYLNGSLVQSVSAVVYNTNRIIIGKSGDNGRPLNGYIHDVRVYDYALRADEISGIGTRQASQYARNLLNYNMPKNYLVNVRNWYTNLSIYKIGSYTSNSGLSDPDVTNQLTSTAAANSSNTLYNSTRIQNYNSFTCAFSMYAENVTEHGFYFYCGATALTTVPTCTIGTSANSGYYIYFLLAGSGTRGVYLFNNQGQQLAYYPFPNPALTSSNYVPITIVYNRSVTKTWTVNVANKDVLVFNDPNNENWVSNIAGDFWGIGARTTTSGMDCYIRRVELSYTPYENRLSTVANVQNNTKFPPGAMTADSTTFTGTGILDGVYTASISGGTEAGYKAFDNNTATWAGELPQYNGSTGVYTGSVSTTVINLRDNTSTSYSGEWYQIQVPNAVSLNSFGIMGRQDVNLVLERTPTTFYVAGSNNGSTWELIHSTSGAEYTLSMLYFTCNAGNTNKYRYFRLIANKLGNSGATIRREYFSVAAWDLFTQINTVNAAVIAVPPYSMTANTTTFSGNSLYDGTYTLTSSNNNYNNPFNAFDDTYSNINKTWSSGPQYNSSTGVYTGSVSTTVSGVTQSGEWIQIQLPNPIVLYSFSLNFWWQDGNYWAKSFLIAGSNDNSTWTNIYNNTNATFVYSTAQTFVVTGSPNAYRYFRLIVRSTSGVSVCAYWFLDQWKLYTNASNVNLMKFPPAPLTADSPVTFTTVNTKNWYNVMSYINSGGGFDPVLSGSDPLKQLQLSNGSVGVRTYCSITGQPVMNYNSFTFSFGLYCANTNNGDYVKLIFGWGNYTVIFAFEIYAYAGIRLSTSSVSNAVSSATNWYNSTWNNIRIVYNRSGTNTWTMFFNETQIIQYSDPNWYKSPGGEWGFDTYNGASHFSSAIRQLDMSIAPVSLPGTSILSGNYTASASSNYIATVSTISSNAFNFTGNMWHSDITYSSGAYTGAVTTTVSGTSYSGEWLQLQAPNALQLSSFSIYPRQDSSLWSSRSPKNFVMAGSNDGSTWNLLHTATGVNDWTSAEKYFVCNGSNVANKYSYFRLITLALNGTAGLGSVNFINLNLFTPISLNNAITPATPKGLLDGLTWKFYNGSSNDSVSYYTTNTYTNIGRTTDTTNFNLITNGQYLVNGGDTLSMEIFGYFRATVSGTYTFSLASDDGSYFWLGANALIGYTTGNANINNGGPHGVITVTYTVTLLAGTYYPIRIHYYEGGSNNDLQFRFTPPGGTQTSNGQGYFFSGTGLDSAFPQESAKIIKDLTNTNTDGVYYILVNGISTPVHCLMNDCYDGGGWMMLMKGTRGYTFEYSSNYWTTKNTLNAGDLTRNDADAKYDTFNYSTVKDVLAIWPDIPSRSYTNPYGQNGGSIFVDDGWTWMVNNWNETTRITPFTGFTTSRLPHQNSTSVLQTYGINNPFRYNGFGDWCSSQTGAYQHVFNGSGTFNIRWGFQFNNETNEFSSSDTSCGIGMGGYSAGDWSRNNANWGTLGINRTARFELYGR